MGYTSYIEKHIDMYERQIEQLKKLEGTARVVSKVVSGLDDEIVQDVTTYGTETVKLMLKPKSVKELADAMRTFRGRGLRIESVEDQPDQQRRIYSVFHVDDNLNSYDQGSFLRKHYPPVRVEAYFNAEDGECKYVKVGEQKEEVAAVAAKTIVKPIFELKCGDETAEAV